MGALIPYHALYTIWLTRSNVTFVYKSQWLPYACITATFYRGGDRTSDQIDFKEITGPLYQQISDAVSFVVKNMRVAAPKDPARVEIPQYSEKAIFEALVNAVVHWDYSIQRSRIRLSMFNDRLEIQVSWIPPQLSNCREHVSSSI